MDGIESIDHFHGDELTNLFDSYMVFYKKPSDPQRYGDFLKKRIETGEAKVFVYRNTDGKAEGFVLNYHCFSSVSLGPIIVLNDLFVMKEARGKGVGEMLIRRVFQYAKETGAVRVDMGTEKTNHTAQRLYEKIGFVRDNDFFSYSYSIG